MVSFWACLILLNGIPRLLLAQDVPADITQSLMVLLQEEAAIRSKLEHDLTELGNDLDTLNALKHNVTCQCPWHTQPVAFSATMTKDITSLGVRQQIPFDQIITNIGNGYDSRHGEFRAPVTGTYEFSVSMLMNPGHWTGVEIVKDGVAIGKLRTGDSAKWTMAGTSVTAELTAGQDVWVEHIAESDSNVFYGQSFSTFSGHLIQP
ncbi:complement C1q-like protein 4 [Mercenaria mercenaria]|uniref:complement C1q-like protein 4 n=1 Tax=Mercenaria mercenaria TaxID=6596 RepID=UPI00234E391D|nr:complement C1q-like protein 4 [Mercenaria mercenaria]